MKSLREYMQSLRAPYEIVKEIYEIPIILIRNACELLKETYGSLNKSIGSSRDTCESFSEPLTSLRDPCEILEEIDGHH